MAATIQDLRFLDQSVAPEHYRPAPEKIRHGDPAQTLWNHFSDPSGQFHVGFWESEPGCWRIHYTEQEYCHILSGHSILRDAAGNQREIGPGDQFVVPAGFEGEWEVLETCRKVYVIFEPTRA